jgi:TPR repeat protein
VVAAQNNLGLMHAQGRGIRRDTARAAELLQVAAANGYAPAQYNLALAYFRGDGVRQDAVQAAVWFWRAAEGGLADAQFAMGQMTRTGRVVARDEAEALAWYRLAAAQGHAESAVEAERLESKGVVAARPEPAPQVVAEAEEALPSDQPAMPPPPWEAVIEVQRAAGASDTAPVEQTEAGTAAEETLSSENGQMAATDPQGQPAEAAAAEDTPASGAGDAPAVQTAAVPEEDSYRVWLLSADSQEAAEELWHAALKRHETVLAAANVTIHEVDYDELGYFYRVLAGPVMDREAALGLCRRLRSDTPETFCKILRQ